MCLCAVWLEFLQRALRVCPGIMTGLHVQSVDFVMHGLELYIKIGIFQSSASARTSDMPTSKPNSCTKVYSSAVCLSMGVAQTLGCAQRA